MKPRKVPERMCIGCQQMKPKRELIRVVRTPAGEILVDSGGKLAGRGAYLCPQDSCIQLAYKAKRLQKALESPIPEATWAMLRERIQNEDEEQDTPDTVRVRM